MRRMPRNRRPPRRVHPSLTASLRLVCFGIALVFLCAGQTRFETWLDQDASGLATAPERALFKTLRTPADRQRFIDEFWLRRDPTPNTIENERQEEHYERILYSNEHFACALQGWQTDRGKIYIRYGPPDEVERPAAKDTGGVPTEIWRYRFLEAAGEATRLDFVDTAKDGLFPLTKDEAARFISAQENTPGGPMRLGAIQSPALLFPELRKAAADADQPADGWFELRSDFVRATDATVLALLTMRFPVTTEVRVFGTMTAVDGGATRSFEQDLSGGRPFDSARWWREALPISPGPYLLTVAAQDVVLAKIHRFQARLEVPDYSTSGLTASSLILAESLQPSGGLPLEPFWLGSYQVRSSIYHSFRRSERLGVYLQVYGAAASPPANVEYIVRNQAAGTNSIDATEPAVSDGAGTQQMTIAKRLPLAALSPGGYLLTIRLLDSTGREMLVRGAGFRVVE